MTGMDDITGRLVRSAHPDEETRYRAVPLLDPTRPDERAALLARFDDPSWRVRAAAVERLTSLEDPSAALPDLFDRLVGGAGIGEREAAAAALGRVGHAAMPGLIARLEAADAELRQVAASVLGAIGDRRALPALTARLADVDPNVRTAAADALGRIGGTEAIAALLAALDSDDESLRVTSLQALVSLRTAPPVVQLQRLAQDRASRRGAYRLIGFSDDRAAARLLVGGLVDPSRSVRGAALASLGTLRARWTLGDLEVVAKGLREAAAALPALPGFVEEALTSDEPFVPVGAATALGWIGGARQAGSLARLAEDDRYRPLVEETLELIPQTVQVQAALFDALPSLTPLALVTVLGALARAGNEGAFQLLVARVGDPEPQVRSEAIAALGRLGESRTVEPLVTALSDEDPTVAVLAAGAVVRLGQREEGSRSAVLAECRKRAATAPVPSILRVMGALGGADDVRQVRALLERGDDRLRTAAAAAMSALGARGMLREQDLPALAEALRDPARQVRGAAARAFADLSRVRAERREGSSRFILAVGRPVLDALRDALHDPEPAVQASAAEALGGCGMSEYAAALEEMVADPAAPPVVLLAALRGLSTLGAPSAAAVARALRQPDSEVVKEAVAAAARLPGDAGTALLREAALSERWDVRHAVARAVAERGDPGMASFALQMASSDGDPLVARAFAAAAEALSPRG
jgi:HEAT repeat protein